MEEIRNFRRLLGIFTIFDNSDARCPVCCIGVPIISLKYSTTRFLEDYEVELVFLAKPKCSSTRSHLRSKILLCISGIPYLTHPLLSSPITIRARAPHPLKSQIVVCEDEKYSILLPPRVPEIKTQPSTDSFLAHSSRHFPCYIIACKQDNMITIPTDLVQHEGIIVHSKRNLVLLFCLLLLRACCACCSSSCSQFFSGSGFFV